MDLEDLCTSPTRLHYVSHTRPLLAGSVSPLLFCTKLGILNAPRRILIKGYSNRMNSFNISMELSPFRRRQFFSENMHARLRWDKEPKGTELSSELSMRMFLKGMLREGEKDQGPFRNPLLAIPQFNIDVSSISFRCGPLKTIALACSETLVEFGMTNHHLQMLPLQLDHYVGDVYLTETVYRLNHLNSADRELLSSQPASTDFEVESQKGNRRIINHEEWSMTFRYKPPPTLNGRHSIHVRVCVYFELFFIREPVCTQRIHLVYTPYDSIQPQSNTATDSSRQSLQVVSHKMEFLEADKESRVTLNIVPRILSGLTNYPKEAYNMVLFGPSRTGLCNTLMFPTYVWSRMIY